MPCDLEGLGGAARQSPTVLWRCPFKLCYEASYVGFSLQRDLKDRGYHCEVVAPSGVPRRADKSVKTDRIDARKLAQFYANGLLTIVTTPDTQVEHDRDLLRSRQQLMQQHEALRKHIHSLSRRNGFHYKAQTQRKTHWRKHHYGWLDTTVERCSTGLRTNLSLLLRQHKSLNDILLACAEQVQAPAVTPRYREPVNSLTRQTECGRSSAHRTTKKDFNL